MATAHSDPVRRSGVVVEFADTDGNAIAGIQSASITAALKVLNELSGRTTVVGRARATAARPVASFPIMHLSYRSPVGAGAEFNLLARLASALRRNGPWTLVDSMPVEGDPRRAQTVQCVLWHARGTLPTSVILRCEVPLLGATAGLFPFDPDRAELVLFLQSSSCRGCLGTDVVFTSAKTRADAATDRLARELLEHVELERQIYSPQRADRSR